jgi:hypothetical protein
MVGKLIRKGSWPNRRTTSTFAWEDRRKPQISVRTAAVPAEIRVEHLPNESRASPLLQTAPKLSWLSALHIQSYQRRIRWGKQNKQQQLNKCFWIVALMPSFMLFRFSVVALSMGLLTDFPNWKIIKEVELIYRTINQRVKTHSRKPINHIPSYVPGDWPAIWLNGKKKMQLWSFNVIGKWARFHFRENIKENMSVFTSHNCI